MAKVVTELGRRLSFGEEAGDEHRKSEEVQKPIMYNLDNEHAIPSSSVPSGRKEGTLKLKKKDIGLREETKLLNKAKSVKSYVLRSIRETHVLSIIQLGSKWQNLKQRQSLHVSKEHQRRKPRHNSKVRVYSPRMASKVEIRKIKAIEEKKKAKLKMKKEEEHVLEETTSMDSFVVVKCSLEYCIMG
ncbi:hypothetical protein RJT34_01895 [Clitoria ternatea]|uniref:Uncharacterized protein n=1 Tax=Clitoria ternatea TaxID=43366 RepID=A0AAN9Q1F4_CLITE